MESGLPFLVEKRERGIAMGHRVFRKMCFWKRETVKKLSKINGHSDFVISQKEKPG